MLFRSLDAGDLDRQQPVVEQDATAHTGIGREPGIGGGKLVVVRESKKGRAVAVGKAAVASSEMAELKKGNCVKNLHHAGDKYWNAYKTI